MRVVQLADWTALNALHRWAWFPERSEAGWSWIHSLGQGHPGWVIEDEQGLCGCLGNIRQDYTYRDTALVGATGYSLIVLPRAKGGSRRLLEAFREQPGVFATSIFNSNARAAPIYGREGFAAFPRDWSDLKIVWPLAPLTILSERLVRPLYQNRRPSQELFRPRQAKRSGPSVSGVVALDPWTDADRIDRFWGELLSLGALVADRSATTLQRRASDPDRTGQALLFGWVKGDRMTAMVLGQLGKMSECEAPVLDIIDLVWLGPEEVAAAKTLLLHLKTEARRAGASRMRLSLVNQTTAEIASGVPGAVARRRHIHGHAIIGMGAADGLPWAPTPFDGDFGFCLRPVPVQPQSAVIEDALLNCFSQRLSSDRLAAPSRSESASL